MFPPYCGTRQSRMVVSRLAVRARAPSGEKRTQRTSSVCPWKRLTSSPLSMSHSFTAPSPPVGPEPIVAEELRRAGAAGLPIEIVAAPDAIDMAEAVSRVTLKKRSSIHVALEKVREQRRLRDGERTAARTADSPKATPPRDRLTGLFNRCGFLGERDGGKPCCG